MKRERSFGSRWDSSDPHKLGGERTYLERVRLLGDENCVETVLRKTLLRIFPPPFLPPPHPSLPSFYLTIQERVLGEGRKITSDKKVLGNKRGWISVCAAEIGF